MIKLTPLEAAILVFDQLYFPPETRARLDSFVPTCSEHATGLALCSAFYDVPRTLKSFRVSAQLRERVYAPLNVELREVPGDHTPTDFAFLEQLGLLTLRYQRGEYLPIPF
ncbi:MAG: hypothetical protein WCV90_01300 [Candidatus Woesearchaeota archaeon]|jgi:hypothetical protein